MNNDEKSVLIERVGHASEEQAKRTLRYMILKCNVQQNTIARAIKDAVERHTPTPTIVYQQPESEDDDEAALTSSRKKSKKKKKTKKRHDGSSENEEDLRPPASEDHRSAPRSDMDAESHDRQLVKKKTKAKSKRKTKLNGDHDEQQNSSEPMGKKKSKHASKLRAETEQHASDNSLGSPSTKKHPTVIDLITSSDDEICNTKQSKNTSPEDKSSDCHISDNDSSSDSDSDSSDDGGSRDEPQGDAFADDIGPSQESSHNKANQASARSGDGDRIAVRPSTDSTTKASNQNNGIEISAFGLGKKRKAAERTVGEIRKDQSARSTTVAHLNKRSKQNHPMEPQQSSEDQVCRKCGILFPSVPELRKHQHHCKGFSATLGSHHRSEPPCDDRSRRLKQIQKASDPAGQSLKDEPHNNLRLPSRPRQRSPADRGLSVPPPNFVHEPNALPRGPKPTLVAPARSVPGIHPSPPGLVDHRVPKPSADSSPDHHSQLPKLESSRERLIRERDQIVHQCKHCQKSFTEYGNEFGACKFHRGQYRLLTERYLISRNFKGGMFPPKPFEGWTCCCREGKDAPPCITDRMHARP